MSRDLGFFGRLLWGLKVIDIIEIVLIPTAAAQSAHRDDLQAEGQMLQTKSVYASATQAMAIR